jgi:uncharacterized protein involved in outer membrane biogenesis
MTSRLWVGISTRLPALIRLRWLRRTVLAVAIALLVFTLAGFFGVPPLLRYLLTGRVGTSLHRRVNVGEISFNPYTLRLEVANLRIEATDGQPFAAIGHLHLRAAWVSLLRLAPVLRELRIDRPRFALVRYSQGNYNFSDLLQPSPPTRNSASPQRFAINNIQINQGEIDFSDQKQGTRHRISRLRLDIPFIANLPSDVEVFVRPMLSMDIDGSPFQVAGKSRPFGAAMESTATLNLDGLELKRFANYVPATIPIRLADGRLSLDLSVKFAKLNEQNLVRIGGLVSVSQLDLRDSANAPLLAIQQASAELADVQPPTRVVHLGKVTVSGLTSYVSLGSDGTLNLARLGRGVPGPSQSGSTPAVPLHFSLASFTLSAGTLNFTDNQISPPARTTLSNIQLTFSRLNLQEQTPVPYTVAANLAQGSITVAGAYDVAHNQGTADISLTSLELPALADFARPLLAARLASGQLSLRTSVTIASAHGQRAMQIRTTSASVDNLALRDAAGGTDLLHWTHLRLTQASIDSVAHRADISDVRAEGLGVNFKRERNGRINLLAALGTPSVNGAAAPPAGPTAQPVTATSRWQYRIASLVLADSQAVVEDEQAPEPIKVSISALNIKLTDVTQDLGKPIALVLAAKVGPRGSIRASGSVTPSPLAANLRITTDRLDLEPAGSLVSSHLNAAITGGFLTSNGACEFAHKAAATRLSYRGDVIVGDVRVLDRVTKARFLQWRTLSVRRLALTFGRGRPDVRVEELALDRFYARLILNSDGRLNLMDILATPNAPQASLTTVSTPASARAPSIRPSRQGGAAAPINANIEVGDIVLQSGRINWTDNFIKPHYSANLTEVSGKIGAFGTSSAAPANVQLDGRINASAPVDIAGAINPLAPMASVDIAAKAEGIGLPNLTPYSTKYTGYPIEKGTLSLDVHYVLKNEQLTADNHIFIDQLTFGERVESSSAINLPIRLAVALLKNAKGEITVDVPISGSLNDPEFSISQAVLHAFMNLITKIVTSPFTLLANAFGGGGAKAQNLGFIEFQPGLAKLSPAAIDKLTTLATALKDRPELQLNITGRVDPSVDHEGLRQAMVDEAIRRQKIHYLISRGETKDLRDVTVGAGEYDKYLKLAYKAAKFPKPRNFLGLDKSLPAAEMKKLMLEHTEVTEADLRKLAERRADAVRNWLSGKIKPNRLFVVTPRLTAAGLKTDTTRVDLSLE